jgi:hypothetical protein
MRKIYMDFLFTFRHMNLQENFNTKIADKFVENVEIFRKEGTCIHCLEYWRVNLENISFVQLCFTFQSPA